jgi:hypothetical protein
MHGFLHELTRRNFFFDAEIVSGIGNVSLHLCGAYYYTFP